jgi:polyvinyl alcohol dehydrogenase (cytochrome)
MKIVAALLAMASVTGGVQALAAEAGETHPGAALYAAKCAQCHDNAAYKAPAKSFLQFMAPEAIYSSLADGIMLSQAAGLTQEEKRQVADYLGDATLAGGAEVTSRLCEEGNRTPDLGLPPRLYGWGADLMNSHAIPGDVARLPLADIPRLKVKWAFAYPGALRARSQPTIAMGTVFVGSQSGAVYALDARNGCLRWTFRAPAEVRTPIVLSHDDNPGLRGKPPLAFFGDLIGRVYAIDARTGALQWKTRVEDHPSATITGAPVYHDGRVYVPVSSLEEATATADYECCTFRGSVVALDALTGGVLWKSYTIDEAPQVVGKTASGTRIWAPSGAAIWNTPTIDVKRHLLYVGTGDNYSAPTNDRSDAVLAFDLDTGALRWVHQVLANDAWNVACMLGNDNCPAEPGPDFDIGAGTMLVPRRGRDLVVTGLKSGHAIAIDAARPEKQVWSRRLGRGGIQGGIQFGMAYDKRHVYVPISDMTEARDGEPGTEPPRPGLYALDAATGRLRWAAPADDVCRGREDCDPGILAAITVVPGAVFAGHMDGRVRAYASGTGRVLWEYDSTQEVTTVSGARAHGGSIGGGGPTIVDGMVYINSGYGIYWHMPGNLLLAFSVDGR